MDPPLQVQLTTERHNNKINNNNIVINVHFYIQSPKHLQNQGRQLYRMFTAETTT